MSTTIEVREISDVDELPGIQTYGNGNCVHQIWMQGEVHLKQNKPKYYESMLNYRNLNKTHYLWNQKQIEYLIEMNYPFLLDIYNNLQHFIMKVDFGKLVILDFYGGFYIDIDSECNQSFSKIINISNNKPLFERVEDNKLTKLLKRKFINNHFFYIPHRKHEFCELMLQEISKTKKREIWEFYPIYILRTVGPLFLMKCIGLYDNKLDNKIMIKKTNEMNAYYKHIYENSWIKGGIFDKTDIKNIIICLIVLIFIICIFFQIKNIIVQKK